MSVVSIVNLPGLWELESAPSLAAVNSSPCGPGHVFTFWEESRQILLCRWDAEAGPFHWMELIFTYLERITFLLTFMTPVMLVNDFIHVTTVVFNRWVDRGSMHCSDVTKACDIVSHNITSGFSLEELQWHPTSCSFLRGVSPWSGASKGEGTGNAKLPALLHNKRKAWGVMCH